MNKEFEASLKSIETENYLDLYFYRPIGFQIARLLSGTSITPNMITILSIFVGVGAGYFFFFDNLAYNVVGILLLIFANILDCVDGQLARLTGIKSEIGRILDGIAGDFWFLSIYIGLALRLNYTYDTSLFFILALFAGLSHLLQANITDYYKTLHLYFISKDKGKEFQNREQIQKQQKNLEQGLSKFFFTLYEGYTHIQEKMTPCLQELLKALNVKYKDDIPDEIRLTFRKQSSVLMKNLIDFLTFNGRTVVLFLVVLSGYVWIYFVYEIFVLNIILFLAIHKHEKMCQNLLQKI